MVEIMLPLLIYARGLSSPCAFMFYIAAGIKFLEAYVSRKIS